MTEWKQRLLIAWMVLLLLALGLDTYITSENNAILKQRNAKFDELKHEHAETHKLVAEKCGK